MLFSGAASFPRSQIPDEHFSIPDPGSKKLQNAGFASASKNLSILFQKIVLGSRKYDPGSSPWIQIPDPHLDFLPIPELGVKKAPDPGSATLRFSIVLAWTDQSLTVSLRADLHVILTLSLHLQTFTSNRVVSVKYIYFGTW